MPGKKNIETTIVKSGSMHMITVPPSAAAPFLKKEDRRVVCTINGTHKVHAALMTRKAEGDYYIYAGKALLNKLQLKAGSSLVIQLEPDTSHYQFDMPEELAEVLATDPEADTVFHSLTPGRQRGLIHLVAMLKSTDKKIERALKIAGKIKAGITSPQQVMKQSPLP